MKLNLTIVMALSFCISYGQAKPKVKSQTDTVLTTLLKGMPKQLQAGFIKEYKKMSPEQRKEMLNFNDFFANMPKSSKKQLTQNIDTNYTNIEALKSFFTKLVSPGYSMYIEFKPPEKILHLDESVDFWVFKRGDSSGNSKVVFQEWNVEIKSLKLDSLLGLTTLKRSDLYTLKKYLDRANCISISNEDVCEIGYAKSGMGKYSYLIFDTPLSKDDKEKYNNGCEYIYYKNNIVLEYGGGAVGPQCFPDKE